MTRHLECPYCEVRFLVEDYVTPDIFFNRVEEVDVCIYFLECPSCDELIALLIEGVFSEPPHQYLENIINQTTLYPIGISKSVPNEVPKKYGVDFKEASAIVNLSPKASAALSRRILQQIIRDEYGIKYRSLAQEIEEFIENADVPHYLKEEIDAVRNIGNFAAHPSKDINTGEIVEVEEGEAEWLIEVLDELFDVTFVKPNRALERKNALNEKLKKIGKPPMKD